MLVRYIQNKHFFVKLFYKVFKHRRMKSIHVNITWHRTHYKNKHNNTCYKIKWLLLLKWVTICGEKCCIFYFHFLEFSFLLHMMIKTPWVSDIVEIPQNYIDPQNILANKMSLKISSRTHQVVFTGISSPLPSLLENIGL